MWFHPANKSVSTRLNLSVNLEYLVCRWYTSISVEIKRILFDKSAIYINSSNVQILIVGSIGETDGNIEPNMASEGYIECLILPNYGINKTFLL